MNNSDMGIPTSGKNDTCFQGGRMNITKNTAPRHIAKYLHEQGLAPDDIVEFGKAIARHAGGFVSYAPKAQTLESIRDVLAKLALITGKSDAYNHIDVCFVEYNVEPHSARLDADDLLNVHEIGEDDELLDYYEANLDMIDPCGDVEEFIHCVEYSPVTYDEPNDKVLELRRELAELMASLPHPYGWYGRAYD